MDIFYTNALDNAWDTVDNWFEDASCTIPAGRIPTTADVVRLRANVDSGPTGAVTIASLELDSGVACVAGSVLNVSGTTTVNTSAILSSTGSTFVTVNALSGSTLAGTINGTHLALAGVLEGEFIGTTATMTAGSVAASGTINVTTLRVEGGTLEGTVTVTSIVFTIAGAESVLGQVYGASSVETPASGGGGGPLGGPAIEF